MYVRPARVPIHMPMTARMPRDNRYDYRDDVSEPDDYAEPNRSVYDESDEDYTPERPDYSHDYDDDDYRGGYSSNY